MSRRVVDAGKGNGSAGSAAAPVDAARRGFMAGGAAFAATALAPGVTLMAYPESAGAASAPARRWGMLIDTRLCPEGCTDCVTACSTEFGWGPAAGQGPRPETDPQWIRKIAGKDPDTGASFSLPVMCQHCAEPPCVDVCPTGASFKRADGIVLVDRHICIGCRYCMMACPYKARSFVHEEVQDQKPYAPRGKGTVEACTLCVHRIDRGGQPACVEACAAAGHNAMIFGDLGDPASEISRRVAEHRTTRIRADLGTDPGIHYEI